MVAPSDNAQRVSRTAGVPFVKYQALGNDYLVLHPADVPQGLTPAQIRLFCDRHYGVGSDGLLLGPFEDAACDFRLRLYNPDGGEFEKSGNGLRIFCRYLWDIGQVVEDPFSIATSGGAVCAQVHPGARQVTVEMGQVSFDSRRIPVHGPPREVLNERLEVAGEELRFCAASIGNPHCIVLRETVSAQDARRWGPLIENEPRFPNRTNVQFMQVLDRANIRIEIWERGVGYTLASGSSSSVCAAVAHRLGLCDAQVNVHMPGGVIEITLDKAFSITMKGPVAKVCEGFLSVEAWKKVERTT